jgi:hypothetical protein
MKRNLHPALSLWEALSALILAGAFFAPWVISLGKPISGPEIRAMLEAPHRLISIFSAHSRVSADYRLSPLLWAVPVAAGLVLLAIALRRYRAWMGLLAGGAALFAYLFLRREIAAFPMHHLAWGAYLALAAGIGLLASPVLRFLLR